MKVCVYCSRMRRNKGDRCPLCNQTVWASSSDDFYWPSHCGQVSNNCSMRVNGKGVSSACVCCVCVCFLCAGRFDHVASPKRARGNPYKDRLTETFFQDMHGLLNGFDQQWLALHADDHTLSCRALAFSMISCHACGVSARLRHARRSFPFRLFGLLRSRHREATIEELEYIRESCRCRLDPFSASFLDRYHGRLGSDQSLSVLHAVGTHRRLDIMRIECRNAAINKLSRQDAAVWWTLLEKLSADFILAQQRILERSGISAQGKAADSRGQGRNRKHDALNSSSSGKRRGGTPGRKGVEQLRGSRWQPWLMLPPEPLHRLHALIHKWLLTMAGR